MNATTAPGRIFLVAHGATVFRYPPIWWHSRFQGSAAIGFRQFKSKCVLMSHLGCSTELLATGSVEPWGSNGKQSG